jgi:hypothetical protein
VVFQVRRGVISRAFHGWFHSCFCDRFTGDFSSARVSFQRDFTERFCEIIQCNTFGGRLQ